MSATRNDVVNTIIDLLGNGGDRETAERLYDALRADNRIVYDDYVGLRLAENIDLIAEAANLDAAE